MSKNNLPRKVIVHHSENITPNMQRVVFSGEQLNDFPQGQESAYLKILFAANGEPLTSLSQCNTDEKSSILRRTYTVRNFDQENKLLTIDFVLHEHNGISGPASKWAKQSKIGDQIIITGPMSKKLVNNEADWFFLVADMTALPALSCNLEQMPKDAKGYAVIEINDDCDRQILNAPDGIKIDWVVNTNDPLLSEKLINRVDTQPWFEGTPSIWVACEFSKMRQLRHYFYQVREVERSNIYISSYWKIGRSEDQHKIDKGKDAKAQM